MLWDWAGRDLVGLKRKLVYLENGEVVSWLGGWGRLGAAEGCWGLLWAAGGWGLLGAVGGRRAGGGLAAGWRAGWRAGALGLWGSGALGLCWARALGSGLWALGSGLWAGLGAGLVFFGKWRGCVPTWLGGWGRLGAAEGCWGLLWAAGGCCGLLGAAGGCWGLLGGGGLAAGWRAGGLAGGLGLWGSGALLGSGSGLGSSGFETEIGLLVNGEVVSCAVGLGWARSSGFETEIGLLENGEVVSRPEKKVSRWPTATSNFYLFLS